MIPTLTAEANLRLALTLQGVYGQRRNELAAAALERVGLAARRDHRPGQLSVGQQQRVAVARAIVHRPAVLLADEPTANLDRATAAQLMELLAELNRDLGTTIVLVTHDEAIAGRYCRRTLAMDDGCLTGGLLPEGCFAGARHIPALKLQRRRRRRSRDEVVGALPPGPGRRRPRSAAFGADRLGRGDWLRRAGVDDRLCAGPAASDRNAAEAVGHAQRHSRFGPRPRQSISRRLGGKLPPTDASRSTTRRSKGFGQSTGVRYVYPDMSLHDVEIEHGDKKASSFALALPREIGGVDQFASMLVAGTFFSLDDAPEVLVANPLLDDLGFKSASEALGQTATISTAGLATADAKGQFEFQRKTLEVRIVGVFDPPTMGAFGPRSLQNALLVPVDLLQQLPGLVESQLWRMRRQGTSAMDTYASVTVRAEDPSAVPRIAKVIRERGFHAHTVLSQLEDMRIAFLFIESLLTAVGSVALVIAGLGIANTLLMTVLERYEEIGLYKAIGATDGDVRLMFMAEAAVLGLVGSLAGLVLAAVVCWALQWGVNVYLARQGVEHAVDVFYFPWWLLVDAVAVTTTMSIVSGLYPASRAVRVDPIKALRRA